MMRGPNDSKVRLRILRQGLDQPIDITLVREIIHVHAVTSRPEGDDIGYIRISQFNSHATDELKDAIASLQRAITEDKLRGYILDLRNNPGGLLDEAVSASNAFMVRGEIVSTRGRESQDNERFVATPGRGDLTKGKSLIVLINGGSASASEIVAGALQDHKRATILSTRSFGKGSVQTIIPLAGGNGALRLTTSRYFTPSGRSIQAQGIVPDIEVLQDVPAESNEVKKVRSEATLEGHLSAPDGTEEHGSQSYIPPDPKDDKALHMAEDLLRGVAHDPAFPPSARQAAAR